MRCSVNDPAFHPIYSFYPEIRTPSREKGTVRDTGYSQRYRGQSGIQGTVRDTGTRQKYRDTSELQGMLGVKGTIRDPRASKSQ